MIGLIPLITNLTGRQPKRFGLSHELIDSIPALAGLVSDAEVGDDGSLGTSPRLDRNDDGLNSGFVALSDAIDHDPYTQHSGVLNVNSQ